MKSTTAVGTRLRRRPLNVCLATALCLTAVADALASTWTVDTCADTDTGNVILQTGGLRYVVFSAMSGDVIDLGQLPLSCLISDSTITLTAGEIVVSQASLTIMGPSGGGVAISGDHKSRIFNHTSSGGALTIKSLAIKDGTGTAPPVNKGGCISSAGDVIIRDAHVTGCSISGNYDYSLGGGVFAGGRLTLTGSEITDNKATTTSGTGGAGGGVASHHGIDVNYSSIIGNTADGPGGGASIVSLSTATGINIAHSTISGNFAGGSGGGLYVANYFNPAIIHNSTISGNAATKGGGGVFTTSGAKPIAAGVGISNSTVAFNYSRSPTSSGGGIEECCGPGQLQLVSTIVSNNTAGVMSRTPDDIALPSGSTFAGHNDLVQVSNIPVPADTLRVDPKLAPLANHGGFTLTHTPLPGSPTIGVGDNTFGETVDQRGVGYPRLSAGKTDIGAVQFDTIFVDGVEVKDFN